MKSYSQLEFTQQNKHWFSITSESFEPNFLLAAIEQVNEYLWLVVLYTSRPKKISEDYKDNERFRTIQMCSKCEPLSHKNIVKKNKANQNTAARSWKQVVAVVAQISWERFWTLGRPRLATLSGQKNRRPCLRSDNR